MATLELDVQIASEDDDVPEPGQLEQWILAALDGGRFEADDSLPVEMTIRVVDTRESQQLNHTYRQKNKPTNDDLLSGYWPIVRKREGENLAEHWD